MRNQGDVSGNGQNNESDRRLTRLQAFKNEMHKWFYIEDDSHIDIIFGAMFANILDTKPVWVYIIAPPGGGKTEVLQACEGHRLIYSLTTLTPKTLVSGKILEPGEADPSLFPKLDNKVVLIRDFSALLSGCQKDLAAIYGQLRDAYDGRLKAAYGTGKDDEYHAKIGIVAATTPEIYRRLGKISDLGERFLMYELPRPTREEAHRRTLLAAESRSKKNQEAALRAAAHCVLDLADKPVVPEISEESMRILAETAECVATARTDVHRNDYTREIDDIPTPEIATRLVKQLVALAQGIAIANESEVVTAGHVRLTQKVASSCVSPVRRSLLKGLAEAYPKGVTEGMLVEQLRLTRQTVHRGLEDLCALGIVDRCRRSAKTPTLPDEWTLNKEHAHFWCGYGDTSKTGQKCVVPVFPSRTKEGNNKPDDRGDFPGNREIDAETQVEPPTSVAEPSPVVQTGSEQKVLTPFQERLTALGEQ